MLYKLSNKLLYNYLFNNWLLTVCMKNAFWMRNSLYTTALLMLQSWSLSQLLSIILNLTIRFKWICSSYCGRGKHKTNKENIYYTKKYDIIYLSMYFLDKFLNFLETQNNGSVWYLDSLWLQTRWCTSVHVARSWPPVWRRCSWRVATAPPVHNNTPTWTRAAARTQSARRKRDAADAKPKG